MLLLCYFFRQSLSNEVIKFWIFIFVSFLNFEKLENFSEFSVKKLKVLQFFKKQKLNFQSFSSFSKSFSSFSKAFPLFLTAFLLFQWAFLLFQRDFLLFQKLQEFWHSWNFEKSFKAFLPFLDAKLLINSQFLQAAKPFKFTAQKLHVRAGVRGSFRKAVT